MAWVCGAVLAITLRASAFGAEPENPGDNAGTSPSPPASLSERTRIIERFPVQDDTVTVSITVMHDDDEQGPDSTITSIRIANRRGGELYREEIPTYVKDDRLWDETLVSIYRFQWRGRLGFRLDQEYSPCDPSSACASSMYFLIRGGGVELASSWSDVFGDSDLENANPQAIKRIAPVPFGSTILLQETRSTMSSCLHR